MVGNKETKSEQLVHYYLKCNSDEVISKFCQFSIASSILNTMCQNLLSTSLTTHLCFPVSGAQNPHLQNPCAPPTLSSQGHRLRLRYVVPSGTVLLILPDVSCCQSLAIAHPPMFLSFSSHYAWLLRSSATCRAKCVTPWLEGAGSWLPGGGHIPS